MLVVLDFCSYFPLKSKSTTTQKSRTFRPPRREASPIKLLDDLPEELTRTEAAKDPRYFIPAVKNRGAMLTAKQLNPNVKYTEEEYEINAKGERVIVKRNVMRNYKGVAHKTEEQKFPEKKVMEGGYSQISKYPVLLENSRLPGLLNQPGPDPVVFGALISSKLGNEEENE